MIKNETLTAILSRRSIRAYKPDPVALDILEVILKAGRSAPHVAPQSRHFCVLQNRNIISRLNAAAITKGITLGDFQRKLFSQPGFDGTYGAPAVIIVSGKENTVQHEAVCGASMQNMLIAAQSLGMAACWAYFPIFAFLGKDASQWHIDLHIPLGFKPAATLLLGYAQEALDMNERMDEESQDIVFFV